MVRQKHIHVSTATTKLSSVVAAKNDAITALTNQLADMKAEMTKMEQDKHAQEREHQALVQEKSHLLKVHLPQVSMS